MQEYRDCLLWMLLVNLMEALNCKGVSVCTHIHIFLKFYLVVLSLLSERP